MASYEHGVARRWGRAIRDDIAVYGRTLGLEVRSDTAAANEWQLVGEQGGVFATGIGGALTGRPADVLVVDDPHKGRREADSDTYREIAWEWWTETARTRLAPGAPVVIIMTRWHEDDLVGRLLLNDPATWTVINIPAQADHDPEKGQRDPLGREPGEYLESTRGRHIPRPRGSCPKHPDIECCDWDDIKRDVGGRGWQALYQGDPAPPEGSIFKRHWWARYDQPQWTVRPDGSCIAHGFDEIIQSWDMAFKDADESSYVCGQVWGRRGTTAWLLDQVHDRMSFVVSCDAVRELSARWPQATVKLIEDKANGPAIINALRRKVAGMVAIEVEGSKLARAQAVSPFVEAKDVYLPQPELAPWVSGLIAEAASFPRAANDDRVDALSQALNRLLLAPILRGDDVYEEAVESGISPV